MLVKTRAILLKTVKYSENSVIARFYTEEFGLESFIINNIRSKKAPINAAHLQPLNLLEADIYQRSNANLQRIKELRCQPMLQNIYTDMVKTAAIVFMQEVLGKVIIEKEKNQELFTFLFDEVCRIEKMTKLPALYPTYWLVKLSQYLGFPPATDTWEEGHLFLPVEGIFSTDNTEPLYFTAPIAKIIYKLSSTMPENLGLIEANANIRKELLDKLLLYYKVHIEGFNELKSHKILAEVLA